MPHSSTSAREDFRGTLVQHVLSSPPLQLPHQCCLLDGLIVHPARMRDSSSKSCFYLENKILTLIFQQPLAVD